MGLRVENLSSKWKNREKSRVGCRENESRVWCYTTRRDEAKEKE